MCLHGAAGTAMRWPGDHSGLLFLAIAWPITQSDRLADSLECPALANQWRLPLIGCGQSAKYSADWPALASAGQDIRKCFVSDGLTLRNAPLIYTWRTVVFAMVINCRFNSEEAMDAGVFLF